MTRLRILALVALVAMAGCSSSPDSSITAPGADLAARAVEATSASESLAGHVTGSAHLQVFAAPGIGLRKLTFNAIRHADGSVSGEWNLVAGASILHGYIDCLNILPDGRTARLSGIVTDAKFTTFLPGTAFAIQVEDKGDGQSGDADEVSSVRAFRNAPPEVGRLFCETGEAPADLDPMAIEKGNVQIHLQ